MSVDLVQTSSTISAAQFQSAGVNSSFNLNQFKEGLKIDVLQYEGDEMEFEVKGISCAVSFIYEQAACPPMTEIVCPVPHL